MQRGRGEMGGGDKSPHKMEVWAHCLERRRGADGDNVGCRTRLSVPTEDKCDVRLSLWGSAAAIASSSKGPTLWKHTLGVCRGRAPPRDCAPIFFFFFFFLPRFQFFFLRAT